MQTWYIAAIALFSCALSPCLSALLCALSGSRILPRIAPVLSLIAAGFILALGLGHVLPEAMEHSETHYIGLTALIAVLALTLFEMMFSSKHQHDGQCHHSQNARALAQGGAALISGTVLHTLCDGVIIASAYMSDINVGMAVTLAVIMHEIAHEVGDYALMLSLGMTKKGAFIINIAALSGTLAGAIAAMLLLSGFEELLPYALAMSAASFIYVSLSDLLPRLRKAGTAPQALLRFSLVLAGAILCLLLASHD